MSSNPDVILASAGTGKTFKLAGRFLALLFDGVAPAEILATTFTRKAAGEILDRVLGWLARACEDKKELEELRTATGLGADRVNSASCYLLLGNLIRQLDTFNVRTLDSFFVESAKVFALELGMPPGWNIVEEDDDKRLRAEALSVMFTRTERKALLTLLDEMSLGAPRRSVHQASLDLVGEGLETLRDSQFSAWDEIKPLGSELPASALAGLPTQVEELPPILTKAGKLTARDPTMRRTLIGEIEAENWKSFLGETITRSVISGNNTYGGTPLPAEWIELLKGIITHAQYCLVRDIRRRNLALHEFLENFEQTYRQLKNARGAFRFEDFPLALARSKQLADTEGTSFRLSRNVNHLLLDEFQDTSVLQWQVLEPLINRVVSAKGAQRSIFCVGDIKQSIYGWRQGEPRLLSEFAESFNLQQDSISKSYRSSSVVLEAVNKTFADLGHNEALSEADERVIESAHEWARDYEPHEAADTELPGMFVLRQTSEPGSAKKYISMSLEMAANRAGELNQENENASIGILLRGNLHIPRMLKLLQERGLSASGEGGNPLTDSRAVLAVIALLHLADHPGDSAAAFHVGSSFLATAFGLDTNHTSHQQRRKVADSVRQELQATGYGNWLERISKLDSARKLSDWDTIRLRQLVDLGHVFARHASLRPSDFVDFARSKKIEDPNTAAIKVMTIHKSKGLEFDVVILPELGGRIPGGKAPLLINQRPDPRAGLKTVTHGLPRQLLPAHPRIEELYWGNQAFLLREQMCVLYVAMTRAKRGLEMIVPALKETQKGRHFTRDLGSLLRSAFRTNPDDLKEVLWEQNSELAWHHGIKATEQRPTPGTPELKLLGSTTPRNLQRKSPSMLSSNLVTVAQLFSRSGSRARSHGTLVHALFEQVEWVEDFEQTPDQLLKVLRHLGGSNAEHEEALAVFQTAIDSPVIRQHLSRDSWSIDETDSLEVLPEYPFRVLDQVAGETVLLSGFIDRLVVHRNASGKAIKARIYDYKTDRLTTSDSESEQREHHRLQMESYVRAMSTSLGIPKTSIDWELLFTSLAATPA